VQVRLTKAAIVVLALAALALVLLVVSQKLRQSTVLEGVAAAGPALKPSSAESSPVRTREIPAPLSKGDEALKISKPSLPPAPQTPLQALLDEAMRSGKAAEERALPLRLSTVCLNVNLLPTATLESVLELNTDAATQADSTLAEVEQARRQLTAFCATGDAAGLVDRLNQANLPMFGPIEKSLVKWQGGSRSQEYFQAATQVLATPNVYPVQFDRWLANDLDGQLVEKYGLSKNQSVHIQDVLFSNFVTANENLAFRALERCAQHAICPSSMVLTDAQASRADIVAMQLKQAIAQQRWDLLIPLR
jgi:hypothetical protein